MSRLAGRVTFPGSSDPSPPSSTDPPQEDQKRHQERPTRGKGNIRYQGTYTDRFQGAEPRSQPSNQQNRQERYQKPRGGGQGHRADHNQRSEHRAETMGHRADRKPTQRVEDSLPSEELLELEDIIDQISDLNIRNDRSAAQIKRNIMCSNDLMDTMSEDDWEKVCKAMVDTAVEHGEPEFIADLMVALFKNRIFSCVMSDELTAISSKHILENDEKPIPALLSAILCAHWPRQYAKAFDNINPIIYTVVCIIKGWIEVVVEDTERYCSQEEKDTVVEDPQMVNKCAEALSSLCDTAQRQLWVNWMQLTDEIYQCFKPSITHNPNLTGETKARLLDTFIQMNQWTKTRQPGIKHASVQTVSTSN